jgi:hypothetical protein
VANINNRTWGFFFLFLPANKKAVTLHVRGHILPLQSNKRLRLHVRANSLSQHFGSLSSFNNSFGNWCYSKPYNNNNNNNNNNEI